MTRDEFLKKASIPANGYLCYAGDLEFYVATCPRDCCAVARKKGEKSAICYGIFKTLNEILDTFSVNGKMFKEFLPDIDELHNVYT